AVLILGSCREVRVQERRSLPPQHLQEPAAAALGRFVGRRLRLRHGDPGVAKKLGRHWRRQTQRHHPADKAAARQPAGLNLIDKTAQFLFVHRKPHGFGPSLSTLSLSCKTRARRFRRSSWPSSRKRDANAENAESNRCGARTPTTGTLEGCCAQVAIGVATAPPRTAPTNAI